MAFLWATRIPACSSRCPLSRTPAKTVHPGGSRDLECRSSTSKCLSVWAKNILESSLMMAHNGHTGQAAYRCVYEMQMRPNIPKLPYTHMIRYQSIVYSEWHSVHSHHTPLPQSSIGIYPHRPTHDLPTHVCSRPKRELWTDRKFGITYGYIISAAK
jgi:hypothetical protein